MTVTQTTRKIPAYLLWIGGATTIGLLCLALWVMAETAERPTTIAEAEAAISIIERNHSAHTNNCQREYTATFLQATDVLERLRFPDSLQEAEAQLKLSWRLNEVAFSNDSALCGNGHRGNESAVLHIARNVDRLFSKQENPVPNDLELKLLNGSPRKEVVLQRHSKSRLRANGCEPTQDEFFPSYRCEE